MSNRCRLALSTASLALLLAGRVAAAPPSTVPAPRPVRLTAKQAVARALEHNLSLAVERLAPALSDAAELQAEAAFEPELFAEVDVSDYPGQVSRQRAGLAPTSSTTVGGQIGARKRFATGTSVELGLNSTALYGGGGLDPSYQSGAALTVRQALLEGISRSANLVATTSARLARSEAELQLQRKVEQVAAETLEAYFDLQAALSRREIQALAIETTARMLRDTRVLIAGGRLPASEEISARYTLQTQRRAELAAVHDVADIRDRLARLIGLVEPGSLATPAIVTVAAEPSLPGDQDRGRLLAAALRGRGDFLAALRRVETWQAKAAAARHARLPRLDLVGSVFVTGLSGDAAAGTGATLDVEPGYWASYKMDQVGWSAGLSFALPLGDGQARGELKQAELELRRAQRSADLVRQEVAEQLNRAWRAVRLNREQQALSRLAEEVARAKVKNEEALYRAGKTTAHLLAAVQAEATKEQLAVAQAAADLNKALVTLHAAAGDLLPRLHLSAGRAK